MFQAKTSEKVLKIPLKTITVNTTTTNATELADLKKKFELITVIDKATNESRTYYQTFKNVTVAGPIQYKSGQNLIGLVVFSIAVGLVTASLGSSGKTFLTMVDTINRVVSKLVQVVMW